MMRVLIALVILVLFGCGDKAQKPFEEAERLFTLGQYKEAKALYQKILQDYPNSKFVPTIQRRVHGCNYMKYHEKATEALDELSDMKAGLSVGYSYIVFASKVLNLYTKFEALERVHDEIKDDGSFSELLGLSYVFDDGLRFGTSHALIKEAVDSYRRSLEDWRFKINEKPEPAPKRKPHLYYQSLKSYASYTTKRLNLVKEKIDKIQKQQGLLNSIGNGFYLLQIGIRDIELESGIEAITKMEDEIRKSEGPYDPSILYSTLKDVEPKSMLKSTQELLDTIMQLEWLIASECTDKAREFLNSEKQKATVTSPISNNQLRDSHNRHTSEIR